MKFLLRSFAFVLVALVTCLQASADLVITAREVDSDVVFTAIGFLDTTDLAPQVTSSVTSGDYYDWGSSFVVRGIGSGSFGYWDIEHTRNSSSSPSNQNFLTGMDTGDSFGIYTDGTFNGGNGRTLLYAKDGYINGSSINGTTTLTNQSFTSLDLVVGETLTWNWGTANPDSLTFTVSDVAAVPEPSSIAMISLAGLAAMVRRRRLR